MQWNDRLPACKDSTRKHSRIERACAHWALAVIAGLLLLVTASVNAIASDTIASAGDALQFILPATAGALTLAHRDFQGALQFGESAAVTLGVTYALKYTVDERRPNGGSESFPSAHTSISFSAAEFMRKRYGWEYGLPAYGAASFVAYSRVEAGEHHPHDVLAGAAIGIISSYIFTTPWNGWHIQAEAGGKYYGLRLSLNW
jgi:membrane-associated phospholipid phosphatase